MERKIEKFNTFIKESLSKESMSDLTNFKNELEFVSEFEIELYEAIQVIDAIQKMTWEQIEEWRLHLSTNSSLTEIDKFTLRLIDRYCSNIEEE